MRCSLGSYSQLMKIDFQKSILSLIWSVLDCLLPVLDHLLPNIYCLHFFFGFSACSMFKICSLFRSPGNGFLLQILLELITYNFTTGFVFLAFNFVSAVLILKLEGFEETFVAFVGQSCKWGSANW